jgi:thiol-disulfide isomerase/thioredoxin
MVSIGLAAALALAGTADGEESWRMSSLRQDGSSVWVLRVNTGDLATTPLTAPTWFPPFPANSISLASGAQWSIGQARGSVVVVTFWASWCVPCHEELPALDRLYRAEHARGFEVIGINVNEQMRIALEAAEKMNLGFPIALLSREMGSALGIDKLPTTLIVDRAGGIRARWNSFGPGLEATIAAQIRQIMNEPSERPARELAGVVTGGTSISGVWNRDLALEATSAAIASSREGRRILVAAGKELQELRADGEMGKRSAVSSSIGYLRSGDVDADGDTEIVEFRAGGTRIRIFRGAGEAERVLEAPSPLLDLQVVEGGSSESPGLLALATVAGPGLMRASDGRIVMLMEDGETRSVASSRSASAVTLAALSTRGQLRWIDTNGRERARVQVPSPGFRLVALDESASAAVLAEPQVIASVSGCYLPSRGRQAAVATASGDLMIVGLERGELLWRARWPGVTGLAGGDVDGDGRDELVVLSGRSLTLLRAAAPAPR